MRSSLRNTNPSESASNGRVGRSRKGCRAAPNHPRAVGVVAEPVTGPAASGRVGRDLIAIDLHGAGPVRHRTVVRPRSRRARNVIKEIATFFSAPQDAVNDLGIVDTGNHGGRAVQLSESGAIAGAISRGIGVFSSNNRPD